jgi:7-cyano-7-deazaguanine synthase in queuosine biosynthesis
VTTDRSIRVWIGDEGDAVPGHATLAAILGSDICVDAEEVGRYCGRDVPPVVNDLAVLCAAVAYADRMIVRRRGEQWGRSFLLHIPLLELNTFMSSRIQHSIEDTLHFLTGDYWKFEFRRRRVRPPMQRVLPLSGDFAVTMPFSDGLDSFAGSRLLAKKYGRANVLKVRTKRIGRPASAGEAPLFVPFKMTDKKRETTYRSRVFSFFVFAAIAACVSNSDRVVIAENGQGSLGPALIPFRDEWPFRNCHPAFIRRLQLLMSSLLQRPISFEQPFLYRTKGDVLAELVQEDCATGWEETRSCSADWRLGYGDAGCGFCGGCVLRRVSVFHAGLRSANDRYAFDDWAQPNPELVTASRVRRHFQRSEREIASYSIRSMSELAALEQSETGNRRIELEAQEIDLAQASKLSSAIRALRNAHEKEWLAVLSTLPDHSWVRHVAEGI